MAPDASPPPQPTIPEGADGAAGAEAAGAAAPPLPSAQEFAEVQAGPQFGELRRTHRSFAFPLTIGFVLWYLAYVLLSNYAGGFMGTKVVGHVNVALILGLAQFLTTFLIAWWYSHHAATKLDPKAEAIKSRLEGGA